jgi:hypothetical protein
MIPEPVENALLLVALPLVPSSVTGVWAKTGPTPTNEKSARIFFIGVFAARRILEYAPYSSYLNTYRSCFRNFKGSNFRPLTPRK